MRAASEERSFETAIVVAPAAVALVVHDARAGLDQLRDATSSQTPWPEQVPPPGHEA